jgi:hypothetical protein
MVVDGSLVQGCSGVARDERRCGRVASEVTCAGVGKVRPADA